MAAMQGHVMSFKGLPRTSPHMESPQLSNGASASAELIIIEAVFFFFFLVANL